MTTLLEAYLDQTAKNQQQGFQNLQAVGAAQSLQQHFDDQASTAAMRTALAQSGGDPEKAMQAALRTGNVLAANKLAPLVKIDQDRKQRDETPKLLAALDQQQQSGAQPAAQPAMTEDASGNVTVQPPAPAAPQNPQTARDQRISYLRGLSTIPQYANNPIAMQRVQSEIDRLSSVKPLIEHNFPVGKDMVQPHISYDEGRTWQPITGSVPSAKFAKNADGDGPLTSIIGPDGKPVLVPRKDAIGKTPGNTPDQSSLLDKDALEVSGWEKLLFGTDAKGYGKASTEQRKQIMEERTRIGRGLGLSPMEMAMMPQDNKVKMKAVDSLTKWGAFVDKSAEQLVPSIDLAISYAQKIGPSQLQSLNKAIIAGKKEFNNPNANAYAVAVNTVRREYGRLMSGPTSNAMLPVEAMKKSDDLVSTGLDIPSWQEVKNVILQDAGYTKAAVHKQVDTLRSSMVPGGIPQQQPSAPAAAPQKPVKDMTNAELMEYRRKLTGGK